MATEQQAVPAMLDLMTGRWRSQVLHAGVALGIYAALSASQSSPVKTIAAEIGADETLLYRLMRASAGLDLLVEEEGARFRLSSMAQLLRANHPQSLRSMVLLEEGPVHYTVWRHLPALIRDGEHGRRAGAGLDHRLPEGRNRRSGLCGSLLAVTEGRC